MTTYTFPADPIRVEVERLPKTRELYVRVMRGDRMVSDFSFSRRDLNTQGYFHRFDTFSDAEQCHVTVTLLAEWAELCRLCRELKPKEGA